MPVCRRAITFSRNSITAGSISGGTFGTPGDRESDDEHQAEHGGYGGGEVEGGGEHGGQTRAAARASRSATVTERVGVSEAP